MLISYISSARICYGMVHRQIFRLDEKRKPILILLEVRDTLQKKTLERQEW